MNLAACIAPSATVEWATPRDLLAELEAEFGPWDMDVAASESNAVCERYYTRDDDALSQPWVGRCWLNPPYGRGIGAWLAKAREEASRPGTRIVCLLPARTDTRWWHEHVMLPVVEGGPRQVRFLRGRLRFGNATSSAPFPSVVIVYGDAP